MGRAAWPARDRPVALGRVTFLIFLLASILEAQSSTATGSIQGTVIDSTGAAMPGVRVTAIGTDSGAARTAITNDAGQFRITAVAVGTYILRLERPGFTTVSVEPFRVSVGQTMVHRIEMRPAQVTERIEVKEKPEAIDTTAPTAGAALGGDRIEESPAQNRNYLNFVLTAPGVAPSTGSNTQRAAAGVRSATADSGFTFGGMRARNNSISIDGVDNRDETTGGNRVAIGLEMVHEFRVSGNSLAAEFGGASGGSVNVVTHSGTNLWHGDATMFLQNEAVNARNPEAAASPGKPRFRRYQPGTSLNGPIRRDRTFFSTAIEQEWESSEEWSEVPANAEKLINQARSKAEFARSPVTSVQRGLFRAGSAGTEFSFKLNHQLSTTNSLSARYAFSRGRVSNDVQAGDNFLDRSARGSSLTQDHSLVASWISVPTPTLVNDFRVQVAGRTVELFPNARGAMLEIPGVVSFGQSYALDSSRQETHYQIVDGLTLVRGHHQLGFGASAHFVRLDARLANRFGGIFIFPTLADLARGTPDVFLQAFGDPHTNLTTMPASFWVQDRWQPAAGLTVEAGLRGDWQRLPQGLPNPGLNFAPRLGVAWTPIGNRTVFRAGFGLFYDRYPLAYLNDAIQKDGRHGFEQYLVGDAAARVFRAGLGGTLAAPDPRSAPSIYVTDSNLETTYSRKITAGVERSLGSNTTITAEYSSVRGLHLPRVRNIAFHLPPLYQLEQTSRSSYQGAFVSLNRRLSKEVAYLFAYNIGRTWDDASDYDEQPLDPSNLRRDWARSRQYQAHRLSASALFDLPIEDLHSGPKWLQQVLQDISAAPIFTLGSGRPVNALDSTDTFHTGAYPISARPFGLGRNPFLAPRTVSLDLRLMKTVWLKNHRAWFQTGVESFNLANHSNFLRVSPYFAAQGQRLASYGHAVETLNARQIQFFAQIEY